MSAIGRSTVRPTLHVARSTFTGVLDGTGTLRIRVADAMIVCLFNQGFVSTHPTDDSLAENPRIRMRPMEQAMTNGKASHYKPY